LAASDQAIEQIIASSYGGLSALQFQDVCAQSLMQIDGWQAEALRETAVEAGIEVDVTPPPVTFSSEDKILDHGASAGDVMLF
ncbi:MAG TPA: hypothetical protein VGC41_04830, partial [Kofleriaceae bacterium]